MLSALLLVTFAWSPAAVPCGGGGFRHQPSSCPAAQPMPAVAGIILAAADNVSAAAEGRFAASRMGSPPRVFGAVG